MLQSSPHDNISNRPPPLPFLFASPRRGFLKSQQTSPRFENSSSGQSLSKQGKGWADKPLMSSSSAGSSQLTPHQPQAPTFNSFFLDISSISGHKREDEVMPGKCQRRLFQKRQQTRPMPPPGSRGQPFSRLSSPRPSPATPIHTQAPGGFDP